MEASTISDLNQLSSFNGSLGDLSSSSQTQILFRLSSTVNSQFQVVGLTSIPDEISLDISRPQLKKLTLWIKGQGYYQRGNVRIPVEMIQDVDSFERGLAVDNYNEVMLWAAGNSAYIEYKRYKQILKKLYLSCQRVGRSLFSILKHQDRRSYPDTDLDPYLHSLGENSTQAALQSSALRDRLEDHSRTLNRDLVV